MTQVRITAEFVSASRGRIFVLARHPAQFSGSCVLVVPPFAEEMNKSRKMITELARRLNNAGIGVVIPDFYGTGDSEGDFADTDCETWLQDLDAAEGWAQKKNWRFDAVIGIRIGCLIASEWIKQRAKSMRQTVFWQPVLDGTRAFDQFLRLRVAASLMEDRKETVAELKSALAKGETVEVAGYTVSQRLALQLEQLQLTTGASRGFGDVQWFEIKRNAEADVPVPVRKTIERLRAENTAVSLHSSVGEPFWTSTEIICLPELIDKTAEQVIRAAS